MGADLLTCRIITKTTRIMTILNPIANLKSQICLEIRALKPKPSSWGYSINGGGGPLATAFPWALFKTSTIRLIL
jgi:hypothetical protein